MDDRLLIPVADLPGPVPVGAPVAHLFGCANLEHHPVGLRPLDSAGYCPECGRRQTISRGDALDLTPPPLDAAGWPTRIDGMVVAAGMLARALGKGLSGQFFAIGERRYMLRGGLGQVAYLTPHEVPALADIDPADALAPRLAMVACFRARVWEGR